MPTRAQLGTFIESSRVSNAVLVLILFNGIVLGLQTSRSIEASFGGILEGINTAILGVFVVELSIKLIAFGWGFFRSGWNVFDLLIVGISLVPTSNGLEVLRALRVLRLLRLVSQVPKLREIVESIGRSLSGLFWTAVLLMLVFYIFGVMGTMIFRDVNPEHFGTLGRSTFSLFQIMTLESWSSIIARPIMEDMPWAWVYFVPFILIASFMVLNLFIAVIVNATNSITHDQDLRHQQTVIEELAAMRADIATLTDGHQRHPGQPEQPGQPGQAPAQRPKAAQTSAAETADQRADS